MYVHPEQIGEVRLHLQSAKKKYEAQTKKLVPAPLHPSGDAGPTLLFSPARYTSRADILVQIPSKYVCDMLLTRFFDHMFPAIR
jgi:hypothetical protein